MKKAIAIPLLFLLFFVLAGCGTGHTENTSTKSEKTTMTKAPVVKEPEYVDVSYRKKISSSNGFGMEIESVLLTPEGDVIIRTQGELAKSIGWQLTIAHSVKNVYVEAFHDGDRYSILMIRDNGTISAVNYTNLTQNKKIEIMEELGGYQEVTGIEPAIDSDTKTINVVINNDKKEPLETYLK